MHSELIPFYIPWITKEDRRAVLDALESRWLTGGPKVADFEQKFGDYIGCKHAIAVNSCTAGLHLTMRVLNIKPGDEVIVPVFTFAATANAPIFCGARPVFADIDEKTYNISTEDISRKITPKTRAIIPVHYGGQPCDMKEINEIAEDHKLSIVEDCAHSLGAEYMKTKTGNLGTMGCFSFYPTKIITTIEGGMITTNDDALARKIKLMREHGLSKTALDRETESSWFYDVVDLGYNYRLTDVQAALGASQLKRVDKGIRMRVEAAKYYTRRLREHLSEVTPPNKSKNRSHVYHLYAVRVPRKRRDEAFKQLTRNGVGVSLHYTPLHLLSFYKQFVNKKSQFPVAQRVYEEILSLPLFPTLTRKNMDFIVAKLEAALK